MWMVRVVGSPCGPSGGRYGPWTETSQFSDGSRTARSHHYVNGPSRPDHPVGDPQIRTARKFKSFRAVHGRSGRPCAWLTIRMSDGQPGIRKSRIPRLMVRKVVRSAGPLILTTHTPSGELGSTSNDTSTRHSDNALPLRALHTYHRPQGADAGGQRDTNRDSCVWGRRRLSR
jgi:hypothetical protein